MTAGEKALEWIQERNADGMTVNVTVGYRTTPWTPKQWAKFEKLGISPFKTTHDGHLAMYAGSRKGQPRHDVLLLHSNINIYAE